MNAAYRQRACDGKRVLDFHEARKTAQRMRRQHETVVQPYRCQHCHRWHVGEHLKNPKDRRRER